MSFDDMHSLATPLCRKLGVRCPIFAFSHSLEVTVAVTLAGGFAVLGVARDDPETISRLIQQARERIGDRPFGVDLMFPKLTQEDGTLEGLKAQIPERHQAFVKELMDSREIPAATRDTFFTKGVRSQQLFEAQVEAVAVSSADFVAAAVGIPSQVIARLKRAGKMTAALVGKPSHAEAAITAGVDVLVAQGTEAGGHTGTIGTMALVPQVVAIAAGRPVLAAGGIGHGSQIAAALALGAQGAWLGTAWLTTREHGLPAALVEALINSGSEDTVISRSHSGKPCRLLAGGWTDAWHAKEAPSPLPMPLQQVLTGPLVAAVEEHGVASLLYTPAGQSVAWSRRVEAAADVVERLANEMRTALTDLQAQFASN